MKQLLRTLGPSHARRISAGDVFRLGKGQLQGILLDSHAPSPHVPSGRHLSSGKFAGLDHLDVLGDEPKNTRRVVIDGASCSALGRPIAVCSFGARTSIFMRSFLLLLTLFYRRTMFGRRLSFFLSSHWCNWFHCQWPENSRICMYY